MTYHSISEYCVEIQKEFDACLGKIELTPEEKRQSPALKEIVTRKIEGIRLQGNTDMAQRLHDEFLGVGPLRPLLEDEQVTEILVIGHQKIWYEKFGKLNLAQDSFTSAHSLRNFIHYIQKQFDGELTRETPFLNGQWNGFRVHMVDSCVTSNEPNISLRRLGGSTWNLEKLESLGWCTNAQAHLLKQIVKDQKNLIVIGATGSGKTSVVNSLLQLCENNERCIVVEDTDEIRLPNSSSTKLLTRNTQQLSAICLTELVKQTLRMRPDRLVVGEIRGAEAKDLLLALSTGHAGSMGTMHANTAQEALMRLEMLIQMGAPDWSLQTVRRLLQMSLHYIVQVGKTSEGERKLLGIHRISSLEDFGFLIDREM